MVLGKDNPTILNAIEELVEDDLLRKHPTKKNFVGITGKGNMEVDKFIRSNPRMFLLLQQRIIEAVRKNPLKDQNFIEVKRT